MARVARSGLLESSIFVAWADLGIELVAHGCFSYYLYQCNNRITMRRLPGGSRVRNRSCSPEPVRFRLLSVCRVAAACHWQHGLPSPRAHVFSFPRPRCTSSPPGCAGHTATWPAARGKPALLPVCMPMFSLLHLQFRTRDPCFSFMPYYILLCTFIIARCLSCATSPARDPRVLAIQGTLCFPCQMPL